MLILIFFYVPLMGQTLKHKTMEQIVIPMEVIDNAIKNAKTSIAFEDDDYQKQYFRGVLDTFNKLKELALKNNLKISDK